MRVRPAVVVAILFAMSGCGGGGAQDSTLPHQPQNGSNVTVPSGLLPKRFDIVDLGANTFPNAVNNRNAVVGQINTSPPSQAATPTAFLFENGAMQRLQPISGDTYASANDINDQGIIVGYSQPVTPTSPPYTAYQQATQFHPGAPGTSLGGLPGIPGNVAQSINANGTVVGWSYDNTNSCFTTAVQFDAGGTAHSLGHSSAVAINATGRVADNQFNTAVGSCYIGQYEPFLDNPSASIPLPSDNAASEGGAASDLNDAGDVVGTYQYPQSCSYPHVACYNAGFIYHNGTTTAIYAPTNAMGQNLSAYAINNRGWVVGAFGGIGYSFGSSEHAFVFVSGNVVDLNTLLPANCGIVLYEAHDVNDGGAIVAVGGVNGQEHGFLLLPHSGP